MFPQVRKTLDATMQTLQDMLTVEDFDVSDAFQHSRSTESVKSAASETYMSKLNIAKRRANQQETEMFYFTVSGVLAQDPLSAPPPAVILGSSPNYWEPEEPRGSVRPIGLPACFQVKLPGVAL